MRRDDESKQAAYESKGGASSKYNFKPPAAKALLKIQNKISDVFPPSLKGFRNTSVSRPKQEEDISEKLLAIWIGGSTLPISCVEDPNMLLWLRSYDSQATLPSRFKLTKLVGEITCDVISLIKKSLSASHRVSVTTDIWTSQCSTNSFIGVTVHFVNPEKCQREYYRICCREFSGSHTGIAIAKKLRDIFEEFGIEHKVFRILTDSASNMIKACRDINELDIDTVGSLERGDESDCDSSCDDIDDERCEEGDSSTDSIIFPVEETDFESVNVQRLNCIAHKANTIVKKTLNERNSIFCRVLKKTRKYVIKYRTSAKAKSVLLKYYKKRLAGFCKTRWWTDVFMVKSVLLAAKADGGPLEKLTDEMDWNIYISDRDVTELELFIEIMSPFEELFSKLNGELYSTMNQVFPSVKELMLILESKKNDPKVGSFSRELLKEVKSSFGFVWNLEAAEFNPIYVTATYLDPYHKSVIDEKYEEHIRRFLLQLVVKISQDFEIEPMIEESVSFVIPGLSNISKTINTSVPSLSTTNSSQRSVETCLLMDLTLYEKKASAYISKALDDAKQKALSSNGDEANKVVVKPQDPLDFWIKQVICISFYVKKGMI